MAAGSFLCRCLRRPFRACSLRLPCIFGQSLSNPHKECRSWKSSCSASPTPAAASRRSISAVSSSPSSGWTSPAAGNTVVQGWGSRWCGRSPNFTAAPFGWRRVRRRAPPLRWGCQRNNQRSLKTLLFVFRRFACRPAAFLSVWGGQPVFEVGVVI